MREQCVRYHQQRSRTKRSKSGVKKACCCWDDGVERTIEAESQAMEKHRRVERSDQTPGLKRFVPAAVAVEEISIHHRRSISGGVERNDAESKDSGSRLPFNAVERIKAESTKISVQQRRSISGATKRSNRTKTLALCCWCDTESPEISI
jgi:hypothetical protein